MPTDSGHPSDNNHTSKHSEKQQKSGDPSQNGGGGGIKFLKGPRVMLRDCMDYSPTQRKFLTLCDSVMESAMDVDMMDLTAGVYYIRTKPYGVAYFDV